MTTFVEAELPEELVKAAQTFVDEGWAANWDSLMAEALRRFLEAHEAQVTERIVREDVEWGLHGSE